ncbi:MAG TPA: hypothetical protein VFM05_11235, partial [Candidatus Saccharimonadales bacterium]|nr:hypothetical protein [Candidatus Saccharimonadales bacterium]
MGRLTSLPALLSPLRAVGSRVNGHTRIAVLIDCLDAEQVIVFRHSLDGVPGDVSRKYFMLPERRRGFAP